ncbi:putative signal peptide protein [Puccinia sorghi]|uniref:Putative signal peptide protein n=1 Tax=Puccinia sorghi TaxID=27349 RepID=A0A0L6VSZ8_9BASI|nr:putative signal peptide protein [Puccinia sorghi]
MIFYFLFISFIDQFSPHFSLIGGVNSAQNCHEGDTRKHANITQLINFSFTTSAYFQKKVNHWNFTVSNPNTTTMSATL